MHYFPSAEIKFQSPFKDDEIVERLAKQLEPRNNIRYDHWLIVPEKHRLFEGTIFNYRIKMSRVEYHSSLFNSEISGEIRQNAFNSTITLKFRLMNKNSVLLFLAMLIFSIMALVGFGMLFTKGLKLVYFIPILVWIGFYSLIVWRFHAITGKSISDLSRIFDARPETL